MILKLSLLLLLSVVRAQAFWQLKWSDEFGNTSIDLTKWDVTNEEVSCDGLIEICIQIICLSNNLIELKAIISNNSIVRQIIAEIYGYWKKPFPSLHFEKLKSI